MPELDDRPRLWIENDAAWDAWQTLADLSGADGIRMADVESWARVNGIDAARLARKLAAVQGTRSEWQRKLNESKTDG